MPNIHLEYLRACLEHLAGDPDDGTEVYSLEQGVPIYGRQTFIPYRVLRARFNPSGGGIIDASKVESFVAVNVDAPRAVKVISREQFRPFDEE